MKDDIRPAGSDAPATPQTNTDQSAPFITPDQARANDERQAPIETINEDTSLSSETKPTTSSEKRWYTPSWPPTRLQLIIIAVAVFVVAGSLAAFFLLRDSTPAPQNSPAKVQKKTAPKPTTVASALSGLQVPAEFNQRPVLGIMIENSKEARPQAGLSEAGIVFEAIAEGGITRFLAVFQDQLPGNVGPIRSARPYFVQWNEGFRAAYFHVGGSPEALANIKSWNVQDVNQFYNSGLFRRASERTSPHNVYADTNAFMQFATQKGYKSEFTALARKTASPNATPAASSIDVGISTGLYHVHYQFDPVSNTYKRSEGGQPHIDANTNQQIAPSNVVALVMPHSVGPVSGNVRYSQYNPIGSGEAMVFNDGNVTKATWTKESNTATLRLTDASGAPLKLNPGQTWFTTVTSTSKVTYR